MDENQLQALANELAKNLKTPDDLSQFDRLLKKISVEAALHAEMSHHLGYDKNQPKPGANSRNGYSTKTVTTGDGPLELRTPRDRDGSFEPQLVKKNQTRITGMDNQILSLYARGMTCRQHLLLPVTDIGSLRSFSKFSGQKSRSPPRDRYPGVLSAWYQRLSD